MKKFLLLFSFFLFFLKLHAEVLITGILDGTLLGGCPKAIELYISGTEDLSNYRLERAVNGQGFGGHNSTKVLSGSYTDAFVYLLGGSCTGDNSFAAVFGSFGDFGNTDNIFIATMNGNDAFRITRISDGQVIDQFGNPNSSADTYADSYVIRNSNVNANGGSYNSSAFFFPGNGVLKGLTASEIASTVPFGSFILPVELINFQVKQKGNNNVVEWTTATELNNDFFYIERSKDGKNYKRIGKIKGAGTSSTLRKYTFVDKKPAIGLNYYRLHQVDFDGTTATSDVVTLSFAGGEKSLSIKPTIAYDQIMVEFTQNSETEMLLKIFDLFGRLYYLEKLPFGTITLNLNISNYPPGQYLVYLEQEPNLYTTERFIKQ